MSAIVAARRPALELSILCGYPVPVMQKSMPRTDTTTDDSAPFTVLGEVATPTACVELRLFHLPSPNEMWELDQEPIFSMMMPRAEGTRGEVIFGNGQSHSYPVGRGLLRPGGIAMYSRGDGGEVELLRCRFDPALFIETTGLTEWDARQLSRCATMATNTTMHLAETLRREILHPDRSSLMAIDALARLLLVEIARMFSAPHRQGRGSGGLAPWQLARIDEALHAAVGHWPTTSDLAILCRISRSHLSRMFAATTGISLAEHAQAIRIRRAEELVLKTQLPLNRIAETVGFSSPSAFSVAFRQATGQAPGDMRRSTLAEGGQELRTGGTTDRGMGTASDMRGPVTVE